MMRLNKFAHRILIVASGFMPQKEGMRQVGVEFNIILLKLKIK